MTTQRGQSLVEFALTIGLLMLLIVATAQVAMFLHYRDALQLAVHEGAFDGSLVGHGPEDAETTTRQLWSKLAPGGRPVRVRAITRDNLVVISAEATVPALLPLPVAPFSELPVRARATHTVERFRPGSEP